MKKSYRQPKNTLLHTQRKKKMMCSNMTPLDMLYKQRFPLLRNILMRRIHMMSFLPLSMSQRHNYYMMQNLDSNIYQLGTSYTMHFRLQSRIQWHRVNMLQQLYSKMYLHYKSYKLSFQVRKSTLGHTQHMR